MKLYEVMHFLKSILYQYLYALLKILPIEGLDMHKMQHFPIVSKKMEIEDLCISKHLSNALSSMHSNLDE